MNRKIAIGVVTYGPCESLKTRLQNAVNSGFAVYLFDNSPELSLIRQFSQELKNDLLKYLTCGKNIGLGYGISAVCAQAYYESHKALVFFDQDTVFDNSTLNFIEDFYIKNPNMAIDHTSVVFNAKNISPYREVLITISSGSLFFLENLKKINWHNEKYFVDVVDYEFCLRSHNNNLKIGECSTTPGFDHQSEQPDAKYTVWGKELLLRKYSTSRIFDATSASVKLILTSLRTANFVFFYTLVRFLILYLSFQFLVRILNIFKPRRRI